MKVKIIYGAPFTSITGKHIEEIFIEKEGIKLLEFINILINKYGINFKNTLLTEKNEVKRDVLLILNGKTIAKIKDEEIKGKNEDIILSITGNIGGG